MAEVIPLGAKIGIVVAAGIGIGILAYAILNPEDFKKRVNNLINNLPGPPNLPKIPLPWKT